MENSRFDDIIALIERSERILLCTHRKPDGDAVGSIMALYKALNLMGKEVAATCTDELPDQFGFLPDIEQLSQTVPGAHEFIVTLDCANTEVDRLKYHLEGNKIHIVITPKKGRFLKENVSSKEHIDSYDLIITVDVADIPQLGKLYEEHTELFASLPVINIDHHISNTNFGKINLIDPSACATGEILYDLIRILEKKTGKTLITEEVATFLLSAITTDTGSFQNANTTPRAMEIAAELMDQGASQQEIIRYLFRTKKLSTLKLWGKILSRLEVDPVHRLVWSTMTQQDMKETGSKPDDAGDIIDELLVHAPEADIVILFKEDEGLIAVSLRAKSAEASVVDLAKSFGGGGHPKAAGIKFPGKTLAEVMTKVLNAFQESQKKRLGLRDEKKEAPGTVTQVLEGYQEPKPEEKPSLEEKVKQEQAPAKKPEPVKAPKLVKPDIHIQTKEAIEAEHAEASDSDFTPSKSLQDRPKAIPEKRFTQQVPDFLKAGATPAAEKNPASNDGVQVKPATTTTVLPEIPAGSKEPTVKMMGGGQGSTGTASGPTTSATTQTGQTTSQTNPPTPPTPPKPQEPPKPATPPPPPKDPFAIGEDGLTDIERALGGL